MVDLNIFGSSGERKDSFVLFSIGREQGSGLWATKTILLFRAGVSESTESQKYAFPQHIELICSIAIVHETLWCFPLGCSSDNEEDYAERQFTGTLERRSLFLSDWYVMERLQTSKGFVLVRRVSHANEPFK